MKPIRGIYYEPITEWKADPDKFKCKNNYMRYDLYICGFMRLPGYSRAVWSKEAEEEWGGGVFCGTTPAVNAADIYNIPPKEGLELNAAKGHVLEGHCAMCGREGEWVNLALVCKYHGVII